MKKWGWGITLMSFLCVGTSYATTTSAQQPVAVAMPTESTGVMSLKELGRIVLALQERTEKMEAMLLRMMAMLGTYTENEPLSESLRRLRNGLDAIEDTLAQPNNQVSSGAVKQIVTALAETVGGRFEDVLALFSN